MANDASDQAGFDITRVALGQVLVLADQHDRVGPEAFGIATRLIRVVIR